MRAVPSWNLNCISDKPTLTQPKQTETPLSWTTGPQQYYASSLESNVRMKRGGDGGGG